MADVIVADRRHHAHGHSKSISGLDSGMGRTTAPKIEMVPNPAFSFPMKPLTTTNSPTPRPQAAMLSIAAPSTTHRRATSALPSFSFNSTDTSGRRDGSSPPTTPELGAVDSGNTASRKGHRRGGSELVGGDSRFGMTKTITSSPIKQSAPQLPLPEDTGSPRRRSHARGRSVHMSSHDLTNIMASAERSPRLSSSLPSSPLELPVATFARQLPPPAVAEDLRDESPVRPVSRPRVGFSEDVEIIPRPLSTISSETESSMSTIRGHSVNNSISSMLSMSSSSPASPRARGQLEQPLPSITEPKAKRSSAELSKRLEKEGEWLKSKTSQGELAAEPSASPTSIHFTPSPVGAYAHPAKRQKRQSLGQSLGFDRRKSEPLISTMISSPDQSRLSTLSLQEILAEESARPAVDVESTTERRFSGHRLRQWALSKLHRKSRENVHMPETLAPRADPAPESVDVPGKVSVAAEQPMAETDLDAVFGVLDASSTRQEARPTSQLTFEAPALSTSEHSAVFDDEDESNMLDLDAATEPLRTPPLGSVHRRQLHSDRSSKQASASGGFVHRRAESEPALMSFNYNRPGPCSQKSMEDVFEEEEEEDVETRRMEEPGMGITIVDADDTSSGSARRHLNAPRPSTSYTSPSPRLFVPSAALDRPASLVDEVIVEEPSYNEDASEIEIVHAHEEPRASSLEKLSDSSEASTLLGASLVLPDSSAATTPHTSAFSSPDLLRRQGSFEASRVGTSASSLADTRTTSSCTTGEGGICTSVDDVPSLISSNSTILSTMHANTSPRDFPDMPPAMPRNLNHAQVVARRKNRGSVQSLSQLMVAPFTSKARAQDESRPQTAVAGNGGSKKKDNRLKKLMFWRSRQSLRQAALDDGQMAI